MLGVSFSIAQPADRSFIGEHGLGTKANSSSLAALEQTVAQKAEASAVAALERGVAEKADASALEALASTVCREPCFGAFFHNPGGGGGNTGMASVTQIGSGDSGTAPCSSRRTAAAT